VKAGYDQTISTAVQEITLFEEERKELVEKLNAVKQEDQVFEERLVSGVLFALVLRFNPLYAERYQETQGCE
jgi:hypothetical protein